MWWERKMLLTDLLARLPWCETLTVLLARLHRCVSLTVLLALFLSRSSDCSSRTILVAFLWLIFPLFSSSVSDCFPRASLTDLLVVLLVVLLVFFSWLLLTSVSSSSTLTVMIYRLIDHHMIVTLVTTFESSWFSWHTQYCMFLPSLLTGRLQPLSLHRERKRLSCSFSQECPGSSEKF